MQSSVQSTRKLQSPWTGELTMTIAVPEPATCHLVRIWRVLLLFRRYDDLAALHKLNFE
jgi:hypothetical protein